MYSLFTLHAPLLWAILHALLYILCPIITDCPSVTLFLVHSCIALLAKVICCLLVLSLYTGVCIFLVYTVLVFTLLVCTLLDCTLLCCVALCYIIYNVILYYIILLCYVVLCCFALCYILYYVILYYIMLSCVVWDSNSYAAEDPSLGEHRQINRIIKQNPQKQRCRKLNIQIQLCLSGRESATSHMLNIWTSIYFCTLTVSNITGLYI